MSEEHAIAVKTPMDFAVMEKTADVMAKSGLFPIWNSKERVMTLMMLCQSEGIDPLSAVNRYDYINGRIAKKATAIQADFQAAGGKVEWLESTNEIAKVKLTTKEGQVHIETFTIEDAGRAQLVKPNSGWTKYPKAMLRARSLTFGVRAVDPGSLNLMMSSEEAVDVPQVAEINVTPVVTETAPEDQLIKPDETPAIEPEVVEEVKKDDKQAKTPKKEPKPKKPVAKTKKGTEPKIDDEVSEPVVEDVHAKTREWVQNIDEDKVNNFLAKIGWGKINELTDDNLEYIAREMDSFEKNVNKLAEEGE